MPEMNVPGLIYCGTGFLPGVPARDLTPEEVTRFGGVTELTQNGLYRLPEPARKPARKPEPKEGDA